MIVFANEIKPGEEAADVKDSSGEVDKRFIPEINIALVGHVDHGKTTLTEALTGKWTDTHSEEQKRGITIRLGYADTTFYKCTKCGAFGTTKKCQKCFADCEPQRTVSFIDAPGHETLMATVLSGAAMTDAALLIIAANEKCPQPQTREHLLVLEVANIKNIIIVQTKIDLVSKEEAEKNYKEIKNFVKDTVAENAPIIPISAQHRTNIDILIQELMKIPTPQRDMESELLIYIARSFDINKPGAKPNDLVGGVLGGTIIRGVIKKDDEIEIKPGVYVDGTYQALKTKVIGIQQAGYSLDVGTPGGLLGIMTTLDPSLCRADTLSGNIAGVNLPGIEDELKLDVHLFESAIGTKEKPTINTGDALMLTIAVAKTVAVVTSAHQEGEKYVIETKLKLPVCLIESSKVAISKQISGRWHLIGWGLIQNQ